MAIRTQRDSRKMRTHAELDSIFGQHKIQKDSSNTLDLLEFDIITGGEISRPMGINAPWDVTGGDWGGE